MTTTPDGTSPERVAFGPWVILAQPEATRRAYQQLGSGSPEQCTCLPCRNFVAVREQAYPPVARAFLERLGVDWRKEAEIAHIGRFDRGHMYVGWFHCIGELLEGPEARVATGANSARFVLTPLGDTFELGVSREVSLVPEPFGGRPLLQLEFEARVPWVLAEPEPD